MLQNASLKTKLWVSLKIFLVLLSVSSCSLPKTTIFKAPWNGIQNKEKLSEDRISSCINFGTVMNLLKENEEFKELRKKLKQEGIEKFKVALKSELDEYKIACPPDDRKPKYDPHLVVMQDLESLIYIDHNGLIHEKQTPEEPCSQVQCVLGICSQLQCALGTSEEYSISLPKPGDLALSTLRIPLQSEERSPALTEAAQVELIKKHAGDKDIESLSQDIAKLNNPVIQPTVPKTEKVKLVVSSVINSASVADRFDYISAYIALPRIPGTVGGTYSLEKILLRQFQILSLAKLDDQRIDYLIADIHLALSDLRVRFQSIENIDTTPVQIELGTLRRTADLELQASAVPPFYGMTSGVTPKSSLERIDNINKELDKRTMWMKPDRSLLRITQRGMLEANISGSFSNLVTINVPTTKLYSLELQKDTQNGNTEVHLSDIPRAIYKSIDALGIAVGTLRISVPRSAYWNPFIWYNIYTKETDGVGYTVVSEAFPLNLSVFRQPLDILFFEELLDLDKIIELRKKQSELKEKISITENPTGYKNIERVQFEHLGIYTKDPYVRDKLYFRDAIEKKDFIDAIRQPGKIQLRRNLNGWYVIVPCNSQAGFPSLSNKQIDRPEMGEIWLGVTDSSVSPINVTAIPTVEGISLPDEIGICETSQSPVSQANPT